MLDGGRGGRVRQRAPHMEGGPCPQHAVFCKQRALPGHTPEHPFREDRAGRAGDVEGSSVTVKYWRGVRGLQPPQVEAAQYLQAE